jgi:cell division protein ZapA
MSARRSVVKVTIMGEDYTIRSDETPEHTRAVAQYVDDTIRKVMNAGAAVESHKAAILAALQITSELFHARNAPQEIADRLNLLSAGVKRLLPPAKREQLGARDQGLGASEG